MRSHQTEQGIAQTYSLMTSLRAKGVPRKLALITLAWAQLLAGTQQPVLSNVTNALPHLAPMKWIPLIRDFLRTIGGQIEVENLPAVPLQRKHDHFLMDIALDQYSKLSDPQHLTACWLHLQVTLFSQYTHSPLPKETILYTDSASVIAKIGEIKKWPYFLPNATMDPDWDVLQQIITSHRLFPSLPILCFAKGHQDADCPYVTLSLPAQLNVDADHFTGSYASRPNENPTIVPMIAGTAVSLHLPSGTTTTKYRSALHKAASTDTIQHYIQNKNNWTNAEFASIN